MNLVGRRVTIKMSNTPRLVGCKGTIIEESTDGLYVILDLDLGTEYQGVRWFMPWLEIEPIASDQLSLF